MAGTKIKKSYYICRNFQQHVLGMRIDATMLTMGGQHGGFMEASTNHLMLKSLVIIDNSFNEEVVLIVPQDSVIFKPTVTSVGITTTLLSVPDSMQQAIPFRRDSVHRKVAIKTLPARPDSTLLQGLKENPPPYLIPQNKQRIQDFFYPDNAIFTGTLVLPKKMAVFSEIRSDSAVKGSNTHHLAYTPLHASYTQDWIAGIIILCLVLLSWIRIYFGKYFSQALQGLINFQISEKLFSDKNLLLQRVFTMLNLNFLLIGGLFVYLTFDHFKIDIFHYSPFLNYLLFIGGIVSLLIIKYLSTVAINWLFPKRTLLQEYFYQVQQFYKSLGLILLPLVIAIAYFNTPMGKNLIWPGIVLVIMLFIYRFFRGYKIIIHKDIKLFYLILYFCALEILPILVLCKFIAQLA
jgi:hypothetical protein